LLVGVVGGAAALACAAALVALPGSTAPRQPAAHLGLSSLPAAAQAPISAALGRDEPAYRVSALRAVNPAQRLRIGFSPAGVTVASGGARLDMALAGYGNAGALGALGVVTPRASANRVSYTHGSLTEWFANGPLGLEQGFDVAGRPRAGSGPLTFSLALSGDLAARLQDGALLLDGRGVALRYGGLVATDARGRVLRSWLELVGSRLLIRVDDRGAVYPLRIDPFLQQAKLTVAGHQEDEFGTSVAVSGNTIVVGARNFKIVEARPGAAFVFVKPSLGWATTKEENAKLTASNGEEGAEFGESVAISGNTIVVGAHFQKVGATPARGAAYVFVMPPSGWAGSLTQSAELFSMGGAMGDRFGEAVAISGKTVVAGAPHRNAETGEAYVFTEPSGGWGHEEAGEFVAQKADLTASGGAAKDELGLSVAVSGKTVLAGAPHHKVGENEGQGAAYAFSEPAGGWGSNKAGEELNQAAELTASNGAAQDEFGLSVAMSASTAVAGAPLHNVSGVFGAAYVFNEPSGGWGSKKAGEDVTQAAELAAAGVGFSLALSGSTIVSGAPFDSLAGGEMELQGAAYLFSEPSGGWGSKEAGEKVSQTAELTGERPEVREMFGTSVAISGDTVFAGAPGRLVDELEKEKLEPHKEQGAAYAFEAPPSTAISSPANGAIYTQGQAVLASYECSAPAGASVTSCTGPVANGAAIDTSTLGTHTFTVEVIDSDGLSASESVSYTIAAAPRSSPPQLAPEPILGSLTETAKTWREAAGKNKSKRKQPPVGTTFTFRLNEAASVTFTFTEPAGGRKVGSKCVAQSRKNEKKKRCTRTVIAGALTLSAHAGANKVHFEGLISKHKKLAPGSYTLLVTATALGKSSTTRTLRFTIARG
jgi:hypothetical protein